MFLLKKKLVCMALYRLKFAVDNYYPYVYTNPLPDTIVNHRDRAFVLGIEVPDELQGDIYEMVEKDKEVELGKFDKNLNKKRSAVPSRGGANNERGPGSRRSGHPGMDQSKSKEESKTQGGASGDMSNEAGGTDGQMGSGDQKDFLFKSNKNQNAHLNRLVTKLSDNMH